jgi:superfamily II DNA/RNA helicase
MKILPQQAKYYAFELTKQNPSDSIEKFSATLLDAKVDLNPHQVEAALFAFKSPLSNGAILADEVGLGKTIEAGILLAQNWVEGKRKLLIICPSNLRKQWQQELLDKFFLPSKIIESRSFNKAVNQGNTNPFDSNQIVIASFHFVRNKANYVRLVNWNLVTIDEAHRLRNVYKPNNIIGNAIKSATSHSKKVLLTATPLQNSLMELYGLVSLIDEHTFGDIKSFKAQFTRTQSIDFQALRNRIAPICNRTLRKHVQEYIRYTNRIPITLRFTPSPEEQELYSQINAYLQRKSLFALPNGQRHLITLIMRKLLASSSFAICGTLQRLINRLEFIVENNEKPYDLTEDLENDIEHLEEIVDEWDIDTADEIEDLLSPEDIEILKEELEELRGYYHLALNIQNNVKGEKLLIALEQGFERLDNLDAPQKALIFTESKRTQKYLYNLLNSNKHYEGKVATFNGTNNDDKAKAIHQQWLKDNEHSDKITGAKSVDRRAALVDYFKNDAQILIATEAAAEGVNMQFCAMVVNYDLPWNPQRIEQRIGRCHRYGQQFDVVVVNFLNVSNAADVRVFQLLDEKFQLFHGVFGASDEILGSIESGVDFEKRIAEIYQSCRTSAEINDSFDALQKELEEQIKQKLKSTQQKLFENFDAAVINRLKTTLTDSKNYLTRYETWLWKIAQFGLKNVADFFTAEHRFLLKRKPFHTLNTKLGQYSLDKKNEQATFFRLQHPLAQQLIQQAKSLETKTEHLTFDYTGFQKTIAEIADFKNQSGWMYACQISVTSFEQSDYIKFTAFTDNGEPLSDEQCRWLLNLNAFLNKNEILSTNYEEQLQTQHQATTKSLINTLRERDNNFLQIEIAKLENWADDRVFAVEKELRDTKDKIKLKKREAKTITDTPELLKIQKQIRELESKLRKQRMAIYEQEDKILAQRDDLIEKIESRLIKNHTETPIFTIKWSVV